MQEQRDKKQSIIKVITNRENESRYVTVIGGIPFYQSTGLNSREKDTWFPFMGLNEIEVRFFPKGTFLKPNTNVDAVDEAFPSKLAAYLKANLANSNFITRLGNFETMCLSMLIGNGFWNGEEGLQLKNFINKTYQQDVKLLSEKYKGTLDEIRNCNSADRTFHISNPELINQWLNGQGSIAKIDEYGPSINFVYSTFKTQPILKSAPPPLPPKIKKDLNEKSIFNRKPDNKRRNPEPLPDEKPRPKSPR